ncbi:MAG: hypothetical protein V4642_13410 [Bacteroidota bacterium]
MKKILPILALCFLYSVSNAVAQDIETTSATGDKYLLHPNGTWTLYATPLPAEGGAFATPTASRDVLKGKHVKYAVWYDKSKWKIEKEKTNEDADFQLTHTSGDGYAIIISEKIEMSMEALRQAAIGNAQSAAPDAKIVFEDERMVNGNPVRCLKIDGTVDGIPITYFNYYYVGKTGSIQIITFTGQNIFDEYRQDFTDFLNGFELLK